MFDTLFKSRCNVLIRVAEDSKENKFRFVVNRVGGTDRNLICVFATREKCKAVYNGLKVKNKKNILYSRKQKVTLSDGGNLLICTPERLDISLRFYPSHNWLNEFDTIIFYDLDLLLNQVRANILEADIIRISRLNPYVRKILITTAIKNVEYLSIWTKSCLIDYTQNGNEEYDSQFFDEENALTQSLLEIISSGSRTEKELKSFFESSYAHFQGKKIPRLPSILSKLRDYGLILKERNYYPTSLGKLCAGLYLPLTSQLKIISNLKQGKSPEILIKQTKKGDLYHYKWICRAINSISKMVGVNHE